MSLYPKDDKARKALPVFRMITGYFPKALREVTRVCVVNNVRYNPDRKPHDINWARGKSTDQLGALYRHITEYVVDGTIFEDVPPEVVAAIGAEGFSQVYVLAEAAWRALAALELAVEDYEAKQPGPVDPPYTESIPCSDGRHACPGCGSTIVGRHEPGCSGVGI